MEELVASASQSLEDGSEPPPVDIDTLYFEAVGGEKKRRIYGLGSESAFHPSSLLSTGNSNEYQVRQIVENLTAKQAELDQKLAAVNETKAEINETKAEIDRKLADVNETKARLDNMEEQMRRIMEQMQSNQRCTV